jgi:two-component system LytT family response regulator
MTGAIRCFVVEDEKLARDGLRAMLSADPELDVACCASGAEAVQVIRKGDVHLVFLDIRMRGMDGFQVIEAVGAERMPVVVFTTAYGAHAIQAFDACALDYLLKPISDERLRQAVRRAKDTLRHRRLGAVQQQLLALLQTNPSRSPPSAAYRIQIRRGTSTFFLASFEIDWIESADNYARIWSKGRSYLVRESLSHLERELELFGFIRVHRASVVNLARVLELRTAALGGSVVVMEDGTRVPVSRDRRALVLAAMRGRATT